MPGGEAGAAWEDDARARALFLEHPRLLLGAGALVILMASISVASDNGEAFPRFLPFMVAGLAVFCGAAYALTMSAVLAVGATVSLTVAMLWALGFLALVGIGFSYGVLTAAIVIAAVGAVGIAHQIHCVALEMARGMSAVDASLKAARDWAWPPLAATAVSLPGLAVLSPFERVPLATVLLAGAAMFVALVPILFLLVPGIASRVAANENFFARSNRMRERRENITDHLAVLTEPRWAFALFAIAVVAFTLLVFGSGGGQIDESILALWPFAGPAWAIAFFLSGAICVAAAGDWRAFFICMIPSFAMALAAISAASHFGIGPAQYLAQAFVTGGCAGAGIALLLLLSILPYRRRGDDFGAVFGRAVNESGIVVVVVGPMLTLAATLFGFVFEVGLAAAIMVPALMLVALVLVPVFAVVLDQLFPPRKAIHDLYGGR